MMRRPDLPELFKRTTRIRDHLQRTRIGIILGIAFFSSFTVFDYLLFPAQFGELSLLRGLSLPLFGIVSYPLIFARRSRFHGPILIATTLFVAGVALGIMQRITMGPGSYVYFAGVLILLFYCYSLLGLPLREALIAGTAITLVHCAIVLTGDGPALGEKLAQVFITASVNVMGAFSLRSSISAEYAAMDARHLLAIQHSQLADAHDELEKRVLERTRELHAMNRELHKALAVAANQRAVVERQSEERLLLVQEVHHRVRNNLQTVLSLFDLESREGVSSEMARMSDRIRAMAVVHGLMHDEINPTSVSLRGLAEAIRSQFAHEGGSAEEDACEVGGQICISDGRMSLDHAVPTAVLLGELTAVCGGLQICSLESATDRDRSAPAMTITVRGLGWDDTTDLLVCDSLLRAHLIEALIDQIDGTIGCAEDSDEVTIVVPIARVGVSSAFSAESHEDASPGI